MGPTHNDQRYPDLRISDSMEESLRAHPNDVRQVSGASLSRLRQVILVAILMLGLLFSSLDASIVSTSLVSISLDLSDFDTAPWVILSYLLAYLGFAITSAKMSDVFGRRALLMVAWALFTGFSIGCGLATDMRSLIVFRAFQGIGGSGLYSLAQIGLFEVGPSDKPSLMGALVGITLAVSFVLGPILGGTISRFASWRWIFFINIPCGVLAFAGLVFFWPRTRASELQPWQKLKRFDFLGNILIILSSSLLAFALQLVSTFEHPPGSPLIAVTLTVASISMVAFASWEVWLWRRKDGSIQPVLPMALLTQRVYLSSLACTFIAGFTYLSILIILPERFQIVNGDDSLMAGVHLLPMLGTCAFGSFLAGAISSKRNNTGATLVAASVLQLIGVGLLSTLSDVVTAIEAQYGYQAVFGLGIGLSFAAATILASVRAKPQDLAVGQGAIAQARVFGGVIGIIACMTIVNSQIIHDLASKLEPADLSALQHNPVAANYFPLDTQKLIRKTYATAFTSDIKMMICVAAVGFVASLFALELHPPPMPGKKHERKPVEAGQEQSETELHDSGGSR